MPSRRDSFPSRHINLEERVRRLEMREHDAVYARISVSAGTTIPVADADGTVDLLAEWGADDLAYFDTTGLLVTSDTEITLAYEGLWLVTFYVRVIASAVGVAHPGTSHLSAHSKVATSVYRHSSTIDPQKATASGLVESSGSTVIGLNASRGHFADAWLAAAYHGSI